MADLFSRGFHCLLVPSCNLPPKPSERLRISASIPIPKRWVRVTHRNHILANSTSPSSSSPNSDNEDFHIISSTECFDGSVVFRFGNASEIREKMVELDQEKTALEGVEEEGKAGVRTLLREDVDSLNTEVDHNLEEEIGSSSVVVVGVADQNLQVPVNEKESVVLDNDPETTVINDSREIDRHLILDSVEHDQHGSLSEDVATEGNVPSVSEEDSEVDSHEEVVVSTVTREPDVSSSLNSVATGEVEEKEEADKGLGVDGATNNLTGGDKADFSESMPVSTSLESEQVVNDEGTTHHIVDVDRATNNPTGGVEADFSELKPVSTSFESEQVANDEETTHHIVGVDRATNNLTVGVDNDFSDLMPVTTSLESEQAVNDEETTDRIVDDSIDTSKMEKSSPVPSSDMENKIDVNNDYENPSHPTVPELHSVETASPMEKTSRTELFLISGAACLPHPSMMVNKPTNNNFQALTGREDAYFISHQNWLGVADGVGQWSLEGSNTGLYIRELMEKCENIVSNYENISKIKPAEVLTRSAAEARSPGSSSVLVAHFDGQALQAANVGNTGFIIIRDGSIFKKSSPMFHEFNFPLQIVKGDDPSEIIEEYKIDLNDGDVIIAATNGLFDNLYEQEIASIISKSVQASLRPQEIAEFLAMRAHEVGRSSSTRSPFADAAQAVGYVGCTGGKLDDVTVIVSLVQAR